MATRNIQNGVGGKEEDPEMRVVYQDGGITMSIRRDSPYAELSTRTCIRLVSIKPGDGGLVCTFHELDLANAEGYTGYSALSYQWGDENQEQDITLNGHCHRIRKNLHNFLHIARDQGWTRNLWVDALCINQNDDYEKSQQIRMMGHIYSRAMHVIIWLGHISDSECLALNEVRDLQPGEISATMVDWEKLLSAEARCGFEGLVKNAYWNRKWVIQEILLGGPNTSIVLPTGQIRLLDVADFIHAVFLSSPDLVSRIADDVASATAKLPGRSLSDLYVDGQYIEDNLAFKERWCADLLPSIASLMAAIVESRMTYHGGDLAELLVTYSASICQERWDNLMALLGLADEKTVTALSDLINNYYEENRGKVFWKLIPKRAASYVDNEDAIEVTSLKPWLEKLRKGLRLAHGEVSLALKETWDLDETIDAWEFQFAEALQHCLVHIQHLDASASLPSEGEMDKLPIFDVDYAEVRLQPPPRKTRVILSQLYRHLRPLHTSRTATETCPWNHDSGYCDYGAMIAVDTKGVNFGDGSYELHVLANNDVAISINYDCIAATFPRLPSITHDSALDQPLFLSPQGVHDSTAGLVPLAAADVLCMFAAHQPALVLRQTSPNTVLCGLAIVRNTLLKEGDPKPRPEKVGVRLYRDRGGWEAYYDLFMRPHSILRLSNYCPEAEPSNALRDINLNSLHVSHD